MPQSKTHIKRRQRKPVYKGMLVRVCGKDMGQGVICSLLSDHGPVHAAVALDNSEPPMVVVGYQRGDEETVWQPITEPRR